MVDFSLSSLRGFLCSSVGKAKLTSVGDLAQLLGKEVPLERDMAAQHFRPRIPWTEEAGATAHGATRA